MAAGKSEICRGEDMRCQSLIGLSDKDDSNTTHKLNASRTQTKGSYIVSRGAAHDFSEIIAHSSGQSNEEDVRGR